MRAPLRHLCALVVAAACLDGDIARLAAREPSQNLVQVGQGELDSYLAQLPEAEAEFESLDSEDARMWASFFTRVDVSRAELLWEAEAAEVAFAAVETELAQVEREAAETERAAAAAANEFQTAMSRANEAPPESTVATLEADRVQTAYEDARRLRNQMQVERSRTDYLRAQRTLVAARRDAAKELATYVSLEVAPIELREMLTRELKIGPQPVRVMQHSKANNRLGVADCDGKDPIILMAARPGIGASGEAVLFFREHEMAHHVLGHVACSEGRRFRSGGPEQELEADCWAMRTISAYMQGGPVIYVTYGHFHAWAAGRTRSHPSSQERAQALLRCPKT